MAEVKYDLIVKNVQVVRPTKTTVDRRDVAIKDGKFADIAENIATETAADVHDGEGLMAFPGAIDAHTHIGIYQPTPIDAPTESAAAASGGVTTLMTYIRTGSLYLNMGGSLRDFFPELMRQSEGSFYVTSMEQPRPKDGEPLEAAVPFKATDTLQESRPYVLTLPDELLRLFADRQ